MESILEKGKTCRICGEYKSLRFFSKDGRGGFRNDCKKCAAKQQREIRERLKHHVPETYTCSCCGRTKPISEFAQDLTKVSGHRSWCKECEQEKRDLDKTRS